MSIASEITRLQTIKTNIRTALVNKGITSASSHNMADFATDISNITSGGATITVTYNSQFYNKTMTCTKGSTTYTKTTTSSGSTTFSVSEGGTWTITCNGVSRTVDVTLEYSTQMAITKTITIYGAVKDTITFTDATGSKTCTFANGQSSKSQSITFIPPSATITFTSTVAKNPSNLSQNFSRSITITESTTEIAVMPVVRSKMLYWYGYIGNLEGSTSDNGWTQTGGSFNISPTSPTFSTNYIECFAVSGTSLYRAVGTKTKVTSTKIHFIGSNTGPANDTTYSLIGTGQEKTMRSGAVTGVVHPTQNVEGYYTGNTGNTAYIIAGVLNYYTMTIRALWYE